jgi:hypothetical protein
MCGFSPLNKKTQQGLPQLVMFILSSACFFDPMRIVRVNPLLPTAGFFNGVPTLKGCQNGAQLQDGRRTIPQIVWKVILMLVEQTAQRSFLNRNFVLFVLLCSMLAILMRAYVLSNT